MFGLTHGELILIVFIFALIYGAGLLPKVAARLSGKPEKKAPSREATDE